jgi:hypothetical protein
MARGAARPEVIFNDPRLHELVAITERREDDIQTCTKGKIKLVLLALCCAVVLFHVTQPAELRRARKQLGLPRDTECVDLFPRSRVHAQYSIVVNWSTGTTNETNCPAPCIFFGVGEGGHES